MWCARALHTVCTSHLTHGEDDRYSSPNYAFDFTDADMARISKVDTSGIVTPPVFSLTERRASERGHPPLAVP